VLRRRLTLARLWAALARRERAREIALRFTEKGGDISQ
jgi:hypothetical protein